MFTIGEIKRLIQFQSLFKVDLILLANPPTPWLGQYHLESVNRSVAITLIVFQLVLYQVNNH